MALKAAVQIGPAAPELRRRCAWLHHGADPSRGRPHTRLWRDFRARWRAPPRSMSDSI